MIPKYISCKTNKTHCEWYLHRDCSERCPYAQEIKGLGCGAADIGLVKRLNPEK